MCVEDKYGILVHLEKTLDDPMVYDRLSSSPDLVVSAILQKVYSSFTLCDDEDPYPEKVIEILRRLSGEKIEAEESCGIFSVIKLTLPNSICYLHRNQGSYYILPLYKSVTRLKTRIKPEQAAEVIMEFDRFAPTIQKRIEERISERKQERILIDIVRTTAYAMIETLKRENKIYVPERIDILASKDSKLFASFIYPKHYRVIKCTLDQFEEKLIERFGTK